MAAAKLLFLEVRAFSLQATLEGTQIDLIHVSPPVRTSESSLRLYLLVVWEFASVHKIRGSLAPIDVRDLRITTAATAIYPIEVFYRTYRFNMSSRNEEIGASRFSERGSSSWGFRVGMAALVPWMPKHSFGKVRRPSISNYGFVWMLSERKLAL